MKINRKNRDRKGGHSNSSLNYNEFEVVDPKTKKLFKRLGNKKLRRQFNKTNSAIQKEIENDWTFYDECRELDMMDEDYNPWFMDDELDTTDDELDTISDNYNPWFMDDELMTELWLA